LGFSSVAQAGDAFMALSDERAAREVGARRQQRQRLQGLTAASRVKLDEVFSKVKEGKVKELSLIIKVDVQGSVEALRDALEKLGNEEVQVKVIHGSVGAVSETDILLASASEAIVIGFNVRPTLNAADLAVKEGVEIRTYSVIYDALNDVKAALEGILEPTARETVLGHAEVRQVFHIPRVGKVAGCYVTDGAVQRGSRVRLVRDSVVIYEGRVASLRRFKQDVNEVGQGYECGIGIEKFQDIKEGDTIEPYTVELVARKL
ncbi:MAG: translation initiation factor IF-2, partial [Nitrospinota bacterium]